MRYLPLTDTDRRAMLDVIGAPDVDALFADVPEEARLADPISGLPHHASEMAVERHMRNLAARNVAAGDVPFFLGAGAYRHHIPASVDHIIQRGEFLTAYTPYQPEIAQGTLQMLFEFQTQVARLYGCAVANASMYDGSTACWEAISMAGRVTKKRRVVLSDGLHPHYVQVARTMARFTGDRIVSDAPNLEAGCGEDALVAQIDDDTSCVVVQYPDILGRLPDLARIAEAAQAKKALLIAVNTEPVALGAIASPGDLGADIVVGEGQSLGVGLQFGGPYLGLFAVRDAKLVRQMPGRLCGETTDAEGKRGFVLTLSTREQHIRREKATSNICTNSGLCALAFSAHMTLLGGKGLAMLAAENHRLACLAANRLAAIAGVRVLNDSFFNEFTVVLDGRDARELVRALAEQHVLAGVSLGRLYPGDSRLSAGLVVAVTETTSEDDIDRLASTLQESRMNAPNKSGWKPAAPADHPGVSEGPPTVTGNRALMLEEPLIFDIGGGETTGVDLPEPEEAAPNRLGAFARSAPIDLPGLSEPEMVRHYTRLSRQNYAIDLGLFPLGSCTMKHNPRLNEKVARMPGFADVHPLQPVDTVQGALGVINELARWLIELTGMHGVAMSPKAGAHGELCGILCIKAALEARGEGRRKVILVPESAHGTNPATAAFAGFTVEEVPANADGRVDLDALTARLVRDGEEACDIAGVMITNPNTCGLFEPDMKAISDAVHAAGGYVYCDGANFNAIVGRVRPGDLGIDAMHINLHKTFSTPHGGGGPGSGPVVLSEALSPFAPLPYTARTADGYIHLVEEGNAEEFEQTHFGGRLDSFGRMTAFHGQMGMFTRALTYILSHGADGLRQVAEDAVLNANYVLRSLADVLDAPFAHSGPCMHEALFSDKGFGGGLSTLDLAKGLIDEGYHPMTVYFPLVVHGAMLVEPTETESKAALDQFIAALRSVAERAKAGDESLKRAPYYAPRRRLDETSAARKPVLAWNDPNLA